MTGYATRVSTFATGDTIAAADSNDEFDALVTAFGTTGHTHDGTAGNGGAISSLVSHAITFGAGTAGTDVVVTFDGETNDGVLTWMEDEDHFKFTDDVLLNGTEKLLFNDTGTFIHSNADGDLDIVSDGTAVDSINLESAGGITLDAGTASSGIIYEDDGTEMLRVHNSSSDVILESKVSDKDIIFKGNDGGAGVTSLTLDMSDAGRVVAAGNMTVTGDLTISGDDLIMATNTAGHLLVGDGTNYNPVAVSGDVTMASSGAVTIANGAVENAMLADDAVGADELAANAVVTASILNDNVTQAKIADDAVGADQLAASAVVTASIVDDNVTTAKIAADAVTQAKIADDAVGADQLAANAVVTASILDDNVTTAKIADDAVTQAKIADDAVGADQLAASAVVTTSIVDSNITTAKIADDAVTYAKMQHTATANRLLGAASAGAIGETQVVSAMMAANSVDSDSYVDGSIDPDHLADNAVTLAKMASGTDGNIISYDASGNPVAVATGNDGQVLTSTGVGSPPVFETLPVGGGGGWLGEGTGSPEGNSGDIIRINQQTLNNSVTMVATDNGSATGPLTIADGITVTISSGATFKVL